VLKPDAEVERVQGRIAVTRSTAFMSRVAAN
jgi:hypothetical protein